MSWCVLNKLSNHVPFEFVETGTDAGHADLTNSILLRMRPHTFEGSAQCSKSWLVMELLFGNQMVSISFLAEYPLRPQWIQSMIQIDGMARQKISPDFAGYAGWHFEVGGDIMGEGACGMEQVANDLLVTKGRTQSV